jgi:multiple sugar transport system ATP-binding protein
VVVLEGGNIQQVGPPLEIFNNPVNKFVAGFIGSPPMNFMEGKITKRDDSICFNTGSVEITLPKHKTSKLQDRIGEDLIMGVRPQALGLRPEGRFKGEGNKLPATIEVVEPLGETMDLYFSTEDYSHLQARVEAQKGITAETNIELYIAPDMIHIFEPGEAGKNLTAS